MTARLRTRLLVVLVVMVGVVGYSPATPPTLPYCLQEDGSAGPIPCRWDASVLGNKRGVSFTITAPGVFVYDQEVRHG